MPDDAGGFTVGARYLVPATDLPKGTVLPGAARSAKGALNH